ncbi:MAG TPA: hypothetical protein DGR79_02160 [Clostridiales bacterium]|nr:hypothetical protein [Clostridiales bacterium]
MVGMVSDDGKAAGLKAQAAHAVIKTRDLTKCFGALTAVRGLTLEVRHGEIFGLLGPNGAGKSTTLRLIAGLIQPTCGEVSVLGGCPDNDQIRRRIGMLSETIGLYRQLTVRENLVLFGRLYGLSERAIHKRLRELESLLELEDFVDTRVWRLSTGQRKRAALARTLLGDPEVLLLDEPWTGLDPVASRALRLHLVSLARRKGATVVICTHGLSEAAEICDRIGIICEGTLRVLGVPDDIVNSFSTGCRVLFEVGLQSTAIGAKLESLLDDIRFRSEESSHLKFEVNFDNEASLVKFIRECVYMGIEIYEVRRLRPNLEDLYMKVVGDAI